MMVAAVEDAPFRRKAIHDLLRGAKRYHYASLQDMNPVVAARHNAYAVALIDALWGFTTEAEVKAVTGDSLKELRTDILSKQDALEGQAFELLKSLKKSGVKLPF